MGFFKPPIVIILSILLILMVSYLLRKIKNFCLIDISQDHFKNHISYIFIIILVALLFRYQPYLYILGGQDQGIYVNMSVTFLKTGKVFQVDPIRKQIKEELVLKIYDKFNFLKKRKRALIELQNKYEGVFAPGIYIKNIKNSEYVFQFYHLHPLWMAIFGKLFGNKNRVWSLVFFSLLSILFFYLLIYEISNNQKAAFIAALLLSINPLHAFFSKFPVTEVVALSFTLSSFYYLVKYYKLAQRGNYIPFYLLLSLGLMSCFFFTRISGFMYIPFYYILIILTLLFENDTKIKKHLLVYFFGIFAIYAISVIYGLKYSFPYSHDIYQLSFSKVLGKNWQFKLCIICSLALLFLPLLNLNRIRYFSQNFIKRIINFIPYTIFFIILLGFYKVYLLGFTDKYIGNWWIDHRWHMAGRGFLSFAFSSIIVAIEHLSPFLFILFIYALLLRYYRNIYLQISLFFILNFWFYIAFLQWTIPYQYYYARYLLSEIIPYTMLFTFCALPFQKKKKFNVFNLLIILSAIYFLYFSFFQFKGKEEGAYLSLNKIAHYVDAEDILFLNKEKFRFYAEIKTPLIFFFDRNVFSYEDIDNLELILSSNLSSKYDDIFVLSQIKLSKPYLSLVDILTYKQGVFEHIPFIPRRFFYLKARLFLYKIDPQKYFGFFLINKTKKIEIKTNQYIILQGFYSDKVWTNGSGEISGFFYEIKNDKFLILETYGWNPYRENIEKLNLKIFIDGKELKFHHYENKKYYFLLPKNIRQVTKIKIFSNTFIPKNLGINNDTRELGMDIKSISFE